MTILMCSVFMELQIKSFKYRLGSPEPPLLLWKQKTYKNNMNEWKHKIIKKDIKILNEKILYGVQIYIRLLMKCNVACYTPLH